MHTKSIVLILMFFSFLLASCDSDLRHPVSDEVREDAYQISFKYVGMSYEWGGENF